MTTVKDRACVKLSDGREVWVELRVDGEICMTIVSEGTRPVDAGIGWGSYETRRRTRDEWYAETFGGRAT